VYREKYGPWAVVIGGSEGVGAELALELARHSVHLVLVARSAHMLEKLKNDIISETPVEVRTITLDVTTPGAAGKVIAETSDVEVGMLICNAGSGVKLGPFVEQDLSAHLTLIQLNIPFQISLAHHFGRQMVERGRGAILLIGSGAGEVGGGHMAIYSASKGFQRIFSEGLWLEMKPKGVNVLTAALGITRTPHLGRKGYPIDDPNVPGADCKEVALACLSNLSNGPVIHFNEAADIVERLRTHTRVQVIQERMESANRVLAHHRT